MHIIARGFFVCKSQTMADDGIRIRPLTPCGIFVLIQITCSLGNLPASMQSDR